MTPFRQFLSPISSATLIPKNASGPLIYASSYSCSNMGMNSKIRSPKIESQRKQF